jgi:hypothetical protein
VTDKVAAPSGDGAPVYSELEILYDSFRLTADSVLRPSILGRRPGRERGR